ncbi:MAG: 2,3,4,5-tetrahydropyridine-2,6-dicarboxylate N-succinyltransferase [Saprospiraceae bacterium]|nr:2,3,4,5-tetrahydropyridine-2,6-dicarboxylate N-succinyltransferase [Saprospiraceae bacterium]
MSSLQSTIEAAWNDRTLLKSSETQAAIREIISRLDAGEYRVAEQAPDGNWITHEWLKKAIVLYFPIQEMQTIEVGPFEFHDKIPLKSGYAEKGVRVVPQALARYGAFIEKGAILMPSYVNIFIGSRCIVVEGVRIGREAVLGANVVLTQSTHIIDVTGPEPVTLKGFVPPRSVVIPGTYTKQFPAGTYQVSCALIIGERKESTDKKVSLNDALRDYAVSV